MSPVREVVYASRDSSVIMNREESMMGTRRAREAELSYTQGKDLERNPISHVRQSGKREAIPTVLTLEQLAELVYVRLGLREQTMVLLDFATGMRRGELSGTKWEDIDFTNRVLTIRRSIVKQRVGNRKRKLQRSLSRCRMMSSVVFSSGATKRSMLQTRTMYSQAPNEKKPAILDVPDHAALDQTHSRKGRDQGTARLAYSQALLRDDSSTAQRRRESHSGIAPSQFHQSHDGSVRSGGFRRKTRSPLECRAAARG
jgi:hypothetical protein